MGKNEVGNNIKPFFIVFYDQLLFPIFSAWDGYELCPEGWEETEQGEEFLGGRKRTRLGATRSTRQHLLTGTRK